MKTAAVWATLVVMGAVVVGGCSSSDARECHRSSGASLCLVTPRAGAYMPQASGLKPGSEIAVVLAGNGLPGGENRQVMVADDTGAFPPKTGAASGVIVPKGSGPVTIAITATSSSGAPAEARFAR